MQIKNDLTLHSSWTCYIYFSDGIFYEKVPVLSHFENANDGHQHQLKDQIKDLRSSQMTKFDTLGGFKFCRGWNLKAELP